MATIAASIEGSKPQTGDTDSATVLWEDMALLDEGAAVQYGDFPDRSVQVSGTFGAGGAITVQGSNNGTDWVTLTAPDGVPLVITAVGIKQVLEITKFIRPFVSAGDGATLLDVTMFVRGTRV
jgi:hypothetical protein